MARISEDEVAAVEQSERAELERRATRFRGDRPRTSLVGRTAVWSKMASPRGRRPGRLPGRAGSWSVSDHSGGACRSADIARLARGGSHGSGSSRHSPRNRFVAAALNSVGLGTLLFDSSPPTRSSSAGQSSTSSSWLAGSGRSPSGSRHSPKQGDHALANSAPAPALAPPFGRRPSPVLRLPRSSLAVDVLILPIRNSTRCERQRC